MLTILRAHQFVRIVLCVAVFGVLVGVVFGLQREARVEPSLPSREPRIISTPAIRVFSAERRSLGNASVLAVKLQNTSSKDIKAYSISSGKTWMTISYFLTNDSFAAGTVIDQFIPLPPDSDFKIPLNGKQFIVAAAYFAMEVVRAFPCMFPG